MSVNLNFNFDLVAMVRYIHSSWLIRRREKAEFQRNFANFIARFNLLVEEEQSLIYKLLSSNNESVESCDNDLIIQRLVDIGFMFKLPNSNISLENKRKQENISIENDRTPVRVSKTYYATGCEPFLYALKPEMYELLCYLKNEGKIFVEKETL